MNLERCETVSFVGFLNDLRAWVKTLCNMYSGEYGGCMANSFISLYEFIETRLHSNDAIAHKILMYLYTDSMLSSNCNSCKGYCCIHLFIYDRNSGFRKAEGQKCKYLDRCAKCEIYLESSRPEICKAYNCYGAGPVSKILHELVTSASEKFCTKAIQKVAADKAVGFIFQNLHSGERNIQNTIHVLGHIRDDSEVNNIKDSIKQWRLKRTVLAFMFYKILLEIIRGARVSPTDKEMAIHFELSNDMSLKYGADRNFNLMEISERILAKTESLLER